MKQRKIRILKEKTELDVNLIHSYIASEAGGL